MTRLSDALDRAQDYQAPDAPPLDSAAYGWQFDGHDAAPATAAKPVPAPQPVIRAAAEAESRQPATSAAVPVAAAPVDTAAVDPASAVPDLRERLDEKFSEVHRRKLVIAPEASGAVVEQYRRLAAVLHHAQRDKRVRSVMIASAVQGEGKTLTATNLALTLSESYQRRVLLIDADLRSPSIHTMFNLPNTVGLADSLAQRVDGRLPVQAVSSHLWVLTAGRPSPDPMGVLVSDAMKQLLTEAMLTFDFVVVDTPPVAILSDANLLAGMLDSAVLVVGARSTGFPMAQRAIESIGASKILGVVLNRVEPEELSAGYQYLNNQNRSAEAPQAARWRQWFPRRARAT
jgi:capsular exopolysaccharide synthesis family protein